MKKRIVALVLVLTFAFAGTCFADNGSTDPKPSPMATPPADDPIIVVEPLLAEK